MSEIANAYVTVRPKFEPNIPRIQILELPLETVGDYTSTPFAIIIDGVTNPAEFDLVGLDNFKELVGAKAILLYEHRIAV